MNDFKPKQTRLKKLRNAFIIITALLIFIYIGFEPYIAESFGNETPFQFVLFVFVLVSMAILFLYESKYARANDAFEDLSYEVTDAGFYYSSRKEKDSESLTKAISDSLTEDGFRVSKDTEISELCFDIAAFKGKEFVYVTCVENADRNDIIAYTDSAFADIMNDKMRYKGNAVIVFVCQNPDESAVALSKTVSRRISGKRVLKLGVAIVQPEDSKVYFRGNEPSVIQKLIARYVLDCGLPIDEKYKSAEKLAFQDELAKKLEGFNEKDFKKGNYFER